jgi:hypothetical protein
MVESTLDGSPNATKDALAPVLARLNG